MAITPTDQLNSLLVDLATPKQMQWSYLLSLIYYTISMQKIWDTDCFLPEILMNKEPCDFIGRGHILVYNLKLCLLNWWKKTLLYVVITILSFWMIFYLRMRPTFGTGWVCLDIPSQKNQRNWCVTSKNIGDQRICNVRAFWPIACEPEFCQTFTFRKKKVKKLHFGPFLFI